MLVLFSSALLSSWPGLWNTCRHHWAALWMTPGMNDAQRIWSPPTRAVRPKNNKTKKPHLIGKIRQFCFFWLVDFVLLGLIKYGPPIGTRQKSLDRLTLPLIKLTLHFTFYVWIKTQKKNTRRVIQNQYRL